MVCSLKSFSNGFKLIARERECKRYTDFKKRLANSQDENVKLNAGQHLLASASSGTYSHYTQEVAPRPDER